MTRAALGFVLILVGCGSGDPNVEPAPGPEAPELPTPPPPPPPTPPDPVDGGAEPDAAVVPVDPPAADPSGPGPYQVGVCTQTLHDPARNRSFDVEYWYPVDAADPGGEPNEYSLDGPIGAIAGKISSPALRNANAAPGARPTVLFSHGFGGIRFQSYFLTERLASHGFIVLGPDHPGNRLQDMASLGDEAAAAQSAIDRPLDVVFALDQLLYGNSCANLAVDPGGIGVTGHSFGGWTALQVAHQDPRIAAVFPMAPGFKKGATPDFVAQIGKPLMLFGGSEDGTTPFETDQLAPYQLAQSPKYLVELLGAGHLDFSNLCEVPIAQLFIDDGCDPANVDPKLVQEKSNTLATAFAQRYLRHDESFSQYLDDAHVLSLGGLEYWHEAP